MEYAVYNNLAYFTNLYSLKNMGLFILGHFMHFHEIVKRPGVNAPPKLIRDR